jgi:carboxylesterase type B
MIPMSELMSDLKFNFELMMAAHLHARHSLAPVYVHRFDYRGLWTFAHQFEETKHDYGGVAHVDDLRYVFK